LCSYGSTNALNADNTQATDQAANCEVDQHRFLAVARTSPESNKGTPKDDDSDEGQEAGCYDQMLHILDVIDC
jgi:hypothetical protein